MRGGFAGMDFSFNHIGASLVSLAVVYGINILGAVIIAIAGWWCAGLAQRLLRRILLDNAHTDATLTLFLSSLVYYTVLVLTFLLILQVIGVQATSLVAVAGATSLAIGLALQGTLTNLAAGVMLLLFRPFRLGDSIEVAGKSGVVRGINIFMTELVNAETVQILIPNGQIWGTAIINNTTYATTRRHLALSIPVPPSDAQTVIGALRTYVAAEPRVLHSPDPTISLANISEKGVEIAIEAWTNDADAVALKAGIVEHIVQTLDAQKRQLPAAAE
jgi:small conductance mechanosensitive channel